MQKVSKIIGFILLAVIFAGSLATFVSAETLKERDERARAMYQESKEQYSKEVEFYKDSRKEYLAARSSLNQLKNSENRAKLEQAGRKFLERAVSVLIAQLETIKVWVVNTGTISESERQAIVSGIDTDIAWLEERLPVIQTAPLLEVKSPLVEVRNYWNRHQLEVKKINGRVEIARIDFILDQAEKLGTEAKQGIEKAKSVGSNTAELEAWYAEFEQNLNLATESYENARSKYQSINKLEDADKLLQELHQFVLEANEYIRSAHALLVSIVKELKN